MPSQRQVRWAELRVGLTVLFASATLMLLIFLMSSNTGLLTSKIHLRAYFDNAEGLRAGAPVRLQGVDIGNVTHIRVVADKPLTPVEVTMKVNTRYRPMLKKDSAAALSTAGVLGETFVDINSSRATGAPAGDGDVLPSENKPDFQDVIRASQTSLQNVDILVRRLDRIVVAIEKGEGSVGKLIYDPSLYNKLSATLNEVQRLVNAISEGKGSIGKLVMRDELYNKANAAVDKLNRMMDEIDHGQGTVGKMIKDPSLYNNANAAAAKANSLMESINKGKGALGKFAKDEEFARKLDNTMTRISSLTTRIEEGQGTIGKMVRDPSLYNNADQMLVESRNLVKAIRENPKKYLTIHFKLF